MGYISQAISCHTDRNLPSPRTAKLDYIKIVTDAVRKYELVPNRREMIHDVMFHHMTKLYNKHAKHSPDSLIVALCEWIFLGRYTGFRSSEWCHESPTTYARINDPEWGERPDAIALIPQDITFFDKSGSRINIDEEQTGIHHEFLPPAIEYVELRIRKQKNNDNYQTLTYARTQRNTIMCPVRAAFNIYCRSRRLNLPDTHPAAVYKTTTGKINLITQDNTNAFLRQIAAKVFKLDANSPELQKWSTHSIRVTAANLLHRAGFSDTYIKNRLRWKSDTFLIYLRNTFYTATTHTGALDLELPPPITTDRRPPEPHECVAP
jgi:hypothetical protein